MADKEVIELAARNEKDQAAVKAQILRLKKLEEETFDVLKKREKLLEEERSKLHKLRGASDASGLAVRALKAELPKELRSAVDDAEREIRIVTGQAVELSGELRNVEALIQRLERKQAPEFAFGSARASLKAVQDQIKANAFAARKLQARLESAKRAEQAALDAIKKGEPLGNAGGVGR